MFHALLTVVLAALPAGPSPEPVSFPHFPDTLHAFVWRNWQVVPAARMAEVVGATEAEVVSLGTSMGLATPPPISDDQRRRSYITVIRRNWHLLPYEQLLRLLGWNEEELSYTLREDDFLFGKLGSLKPKCPPIHYALPGEAAKLRASEIRQEILKSFGGPVGAAQEPLFHFVEKLNVSPAGPPTAAKEKNLFGLRFCSSYFALYGDPLLESTTMSYPDGYLARLEQNGVNGIWLQGVLYKLQPFPWQPELSVGYERRLENLRDLISRSKKFNIRVFVYLNEPRSMPLEFFDKYPALKGVTMKDRAMLCTSTVDVQNFLKESVTSLAAAVPGLGGFFTITSSENPTNCWSKGLGLECPRCGPRGAENVVPEVNKIIYEGLRKAGTGAELIAWDWGWKDEWADYAIRGLPKKIGLMSVSERDLPITRGGISTTVREYSISAVGPGARAKRHWKIAQDSGRLAIAKIQASNTWELAAVPYIPAVALVAQHGLNLRDQKLNGIMLGWTLGGYPSPNLRAIQEAGTAGPAPSVDEILARVAAHYVRAPIYQEALVNAWKRMSAAFVEFPFTARTVYRSPLQVGPANPLWLKPTGYNSSMVGFSYDDLTDWRTVYPEEVFASQLEKVAAGFHDGGTILTEAMAGKDAPQDAKDLAAMADELSVVRAATLHFESVANQVRFIMARDDGDSAEMRRHLESERNAAVDLYQIQVRDSRIGYEASNHYFYVPLDLAEKVLNCEWILKQLPDQTPKQID